MLYYLKQAVLRLGPADGTAVDCMSGPPPPFLPRGGGGDGQYQINLDNLTQGMASTEKKEIFFKKVFIPVFDFGITCSLYPKKFRKSCLKALRWICQSAINIRMKTDQRARITECPGSSHFTAASFSKRSMVCE